MTESELIAMVAGLLSIVFLGLWFYGPWQTFVIDSARQRLFEIRDSWFDYCLSAGITDDERARVLREVFNALIRYTHKSTVPFIGMCILVKLPDDDSSDGVFAIATSLDQPHRDKAREALQKAFIQVAWAACRRSLLVWCATPIAAVFLTANGLASMVRRFARTELRLAMSAHRHT
jgi:hypothetical protein